MSDLRRMAKTFIVLTLAMDFFVFGTLAETIASYSGQYAADLEQKQMLLESIKEDACKTESELQKNMGGINALDMEKTVRLRTGDIDIARIVPQTGKIDMAFARMNGTLSPQVTRDGLLRDRED